MSQPANPMEIFKLLPRTNCRECGETACLAFAAAVFQGRKPLNQCPQISPDITEEYAEPNLRYNQQVAELEKPLIDLKHRLKEIDLSEAAARVGGIYKGGRLTVKVMGKDFSVDAQGQLYSDIHVIPWIAGPILTYILECKGRPVEQQWLPLRELPGGQDWSRFFKQRCEKPLKRIADTYPDLFEVLIDLFNGKKVKDHYQSDIAIAIQPLPLVPMLICYWKPEEGMASDMNLFFDASAKDNIGLEGLYGIGSGIARMFEKLSQRHGFAADA